MRLSGIFLDFDGVISKNSPTLMANWIYSYVSQFSSVPISKKTIMKIALATNSFPPKAVLELFFKSFGIQADVSKVQSLMHEEINDSVRIEPDFYKFLDFCHQKNILVKILSQRSSNSSASYQLSRIPEIKESMICSTYGMSKADPACYQHIGNSLQIQLSEWLLIDDSLYALRAAKIADLNTAFMMNSSFKADDLDYKELIDLQVFSFEELLLTGLKQF